MGKRIKLIWDFRGIDALPTAEHHVIHLNEFALKEKLEKTFAGIEAVNELYCIAYLLVQESDMLLVRDTLIPHRGEWEVL
jgi:hypothetical protein